MSVDYLVISKNAKVQKEAKNRKTKAKISWKIHVTKIHKHLWTHKKILAPEVNLSKHAMKYICKKYENLFNKTHIFSSKNTLQIIDLKKKKKKWMLLEF